MPEVKRLNYFNHQFLDAKDFQEEQAYHIRMRRLHNRLLHRWGIVEGLTVRHHGEHTVTVEPGVAIDSEGREIVLAESLTREIQHAGGSGPAFVTIGYSEAFHDEDKQSAGGAEGYRRIVESHEIHGKRQEPPEDGSVIVLARVHLDAEGRVREIDPSVRQYAGSTIAAESVGSRELKPLSITEGHLAPDLIGSLGGGKGWLRLPFKPMPARRGVIRVAGMEEDFTIEPTHASCGDRGARGSMSIPVPGGINRVRAFRIAGTARKSVTAQLIRTGWNRQRNEGEYIELVNEIIQGPAFHHEVKIAEHLQHLNAELHTLALSVTADSEAEIWLVAVEVL
jgi:hypothetical protein